MANDGVFLNPDTGDIIATGQLSASQVAFPHVNDLLVDTVPFIEYVNAVSAQLSGYYKKSETSSAVELSDKFSTLSSFSNSWKASVDLSAANLSSAIKSLQDNKVDKVLNQTNKLAKFKADGNLESSGKSISDLVLSADVISYPDDSTSVVQSKGIKDFVNSSINAFAAYYITKDAAGNAFGTYSELSTQISGYNAGVQRNPTKNDYAIVLSDENHYDVTLSVNPTTRYSFQGVYLSGGRWEFQYVVNNTTFTQAQVNAINSGIDTSKVAQIQTNKTDIETLSDTLTSDYYQKTQTSSLSELSNEFKKYQLSGDYATNEILNNVSSFLSTNIQNKVKLGNFISDDYILSSTDLSVVKIAADDYYQLIVQEKLLSDVISIISSDHLNAYDQTIINVAEPSAYNDAATKLYVDSKVSSIDLSEYYKKSETSSAAEISIAFDKYYKQSETSSAVEISVKFNSYYQRSETSSSTEISTAIEENRTTLRIWNI